MLTATDDLERYIGLRQDDTPLLVQLALIHYQFETIHPFMDGNGRVGCLMIPLLLHERGQLRHPLLYLSVYFDRHRDHYKDLLLAVSQRGAWEEWIAFFLRGVIQQATEAVAASDRLLALRERYRSLVTGPRTAASDLLLVDLLFETPAVTARSIAERIGVTQGAAYGLIQRSIERGILFEATGRTYNQVFVAGGLLFPATATSASTLRPNQR